MQHPVVYEINTRCWLAELSAASGRPLTLAEIPDREFEHWQHCQFTHVWLMGVWQVGRRGLAHSRRVYGGREDHDDCTITGSPYAITGYAVSRKLGGASALRKFRRKLNQRGIKLILDFIPNHTAVDHPWAKAHPEFYVTADSPRPGTIRALRSERQWFAHGDCGFGEPWVDTLQLDYRNPALRRAMMEELSRVAEQCDGVRCDMAMLVMNDVFAKTWQGFPRHARAEDGGEFWADAITAVHRQWPEFMFVAEAYWDLEERLQQLGFDFVYDKRLYDRIVARDADGTVAFLNSRTRDYISRSVHFVENHDEPRIAQLLSPPEQRAAVLLITALPGLRLFHEGQLTGARVRANVHFSTRRAEPPDSAAVEFYARLFAVLPRTAIGRGDWQLLLAQPAWENNLTHRHIALIQWSRSPDEFDLAVINLSGVQSQCYAPVCTEALGRTAWQLTDLLGDEIHERSGEALASRGLFLDLKPHAAQLFHFQRRLGD